MSEVRVRFAPSPTGYFHIGSARTALYNWLYARGRGGKFVLRIEDTDEARSTVGSIKSIIKGLNYLGIDWDEGPVVAKDASGEKLMSKGDYGPYYQTLRKNFYSQKVDDLLAEKKAYLCFCLPEELEEMRKKQLERGERVGYDGRCRNLTPAQREKFLSEGRKPVVRFAVPEGKTVAFTDIIRGEISVNSADISDFVILRADGTPTYNFACVIDDYMMKISHVIRGEDHISNTPKQILIYEAFGWEIPQFAHLTMILDVDGSRLSKRKGARSLLEYEDDGFIREAMVNYLSLLGWGTRESQNIFNIPELISKFSLERCTSSSAIFDNQKLLWLNAQHIKKLDVGEIYRRSFRILKEAGLDIYPRERVESAISMEKEKIKKLSEIPNLIKFMLVDEIEYDDGILESGSKSAEVLTEVCEIMKNISVFSAANIEKEVRRFSKEKGLKTKFVFHPIRWAVSGRSKGPSLFEMCEFLGREKVIGRISTFLEKIKKSGREKLP